MLLTLLAAYAMVMLTQAVMGRIEGVAMLIFMLAVFVTSMYTEGYVWGVAASMISVLAVNFCLSLAVFRVQLYSVGKPVFRPCDACGVHHDQHPDHPHQKTGAAAHGERKGKNASEPLARGFPDLRTPLTSIYGACSTVIENYDSLDKAKDHQAAGRGLQRCPVADPHGGEPALGRPHRQRKKVTVQKTPTVLDELLDAVLVKFRKRYPDLQVELETPDAFIVIPMDSMLIQQVLMNLLENAACTPRA